MQLKHVRSLDNGIIFFSVHHQSQGAIVTYDNQKIISHWENTHTFLKKQKPYKNHSKTIANILILLLQCLANILTFVLLSFVFKFTDNDFYIQIRFISLITIFVILSQFFITVWIETKFHLISYRRYHGAEHMVTNAYRALNRVPTLEELRKYSYYSNYCGINALTVMVLFFITIFGASFLPPQFFATICLASWFFLLSLKDRGHLNFLQKLKVLPPTDQELLVAIKGLETWIAHEKDA